uniref:Solute carrier family 49 member 4 n=1 Tax=Neolamprologus brichardi TaxID=32507 RepID=A0A3Q4FZV9_NEOBR
MHNPPGLLWAEGEPLLVPSYVETNSNPVNSRVYGRRWLVLTLFSLLALMQGMVWNFWGPIQNSAAHAYGFTKSDIAILVLWGPAGFLPWLLFMWLMDKKGEEVFSWHVFVFYMGFFFFFYRLIHGGQLLNGLAGPTMMSAGPYLSTTWFAPDQRATATAVASLFSYLGGAASFIVGPLIVPAPNDTQALTTISAAVSDIFIRDRIQLVMYAGTKKNLCVFVNFEAYGRCRPQSVIQMFLNLRFLMIALAYAVPTGVIAGWAGVLDMVLTPAKVSQVWHKRTHRITYRLCTSFRGKSFFHCTCTHLSFILGVFQDLTSSLLLLPLSVSIFLTHASSGSFSGIKLLLSSVSTANVSWLNWCLTGSCLFSLVLILFFRESYDRLYLDVFVSV